VLGLTIVKSTCYAEVNENNITTMLSGVVMR
jgi:hypothetical protein